jgi:hypothetical protein
MINVDAKSAGVQPTEEIFMGYGKGKKPPKR